MDVLEELEPSFSFDSEPGQFRERSNTWPLRPNRVTLEAQNGGGGSPVGSSEETAMVVGVAPGQIKHEKGSASGGGDPLGGLTAVKKSGARRNAWGSLSYADLITNAIQSSPDKRLTLSQIYDWMVQNVPFFKDKGDSTSSAGWKNSIRHNLSLHSRFMRIQNEGTGKSSWWVINPDAKPGKPPRRRAGSMDTKSGEKKRGRINKKRQEAMRSAMENRGSPLNGSIDFLDSLGDFRSRASSITSNASSCGRLSPMPPDLHDNQVPPMSPIPWDGELDVSSSMFQGSTSENYPDLANSLADSMTLSSQDNMDLSSNLNSDPYLSSGVSQEFNSPSQNINGLGDGLNESNQFSHLPAPPPYPERTSPSHTPQQSTPMITPEQPTLSSVNMSNLRRTLLNSLAKNPNLFTTDAVSVLNQMNSRNQLSVNTQQQQSLQEGSQQNSSNPQSLTSLLSPTIGRVSPQEKLSPLNHQLSPQQQQSLLGSPEQQQQQGGVCSTNVQQQTALQQQRTKSILRSALTHGSFLFNPTPNTTTTQLILGMNNQTTANTGNVNNTNFANIGLSAQQQLQQQQQQLSPGSFLSQVSDTGSSSPVVNNVLMQSSDSSVNNNLPVDIDMDSSSLMSLPDYDVEQLIKQELTLEGNLDANFDNITPV
ncbi:hypothetical protein ACOMHN_035908 [Nucella lapillus]